MVGGSGGGLYVDDNDEGFEADDSALGMAMGEDERRVHELQRMLKVLFNMLWPPTSNLDPPTSNPLTSKS